jgi:hypothetical protein
MTGGQGIRGGAIQTIQWKQAETSFHIYFYFFRTTIFSQLGPMLLCSSWGGGGGLRYIFLMAVGSYSYVLPFFCKNSCTFNSKEGPHPLKLFLLRAQICNRAVIPLRNRTELSPGKVTGTIFKCHHLPLLSSGLMVMVLCAHVSGDSFLYSMPEFENV